MSVLTGIATETLTARLSAAQTAYLDLCAGALVVSVRMGDKTVQYTEASRDTLRRHILELQSALGQTMRVPGIYLSGGKGL